MQERAARQAAEQQAACTKAESEAAVSAFDPFAQHAGQLRITQCLMSQQPAWTAPEPELLPVLMTSSAESCMQDWANLCLLC